MVYALFGNSDSHLHFEIPSNNSLLDGRPGIGRSLKRGLAAEIAPVDRTKRQAPSVFTKN